MGLLGSLLFGNSGTTLLGQKAIGTKKSNGWNPQILKCCNNYKNISSDGRK